MDFNDRRRQPFLSETHYRTEMAAITYALETSERAAAAGGRTRADSLRIAAHDAAFDRFQRLCLQYTAGEPIEPMCADLEDVIAAYERYAQRLWTNKRNRSEPAFDFASRSEYCVLMQLIGLCFLLRRRDLLPRLARLQDGENGENGGQDRLYEELMRQEMGTPLRFKCRQLSHPHPYDPLFQALTEWEPDEQTVYLDHFLSQWYDCLAQEPWHPRPRSAPQSDEGSWFGSWSFDAGAIAVLLDMEDDSPLCDHPNYPKDLVDWSRDNAVPTER